MEQNDGMENGMDFNLLLTQNLSSNWIVPTDNMQPKSERVVHSIDNWLIFIFQNWCHQ